MKIYSTPRVVVTIKPSEIVTATAIAWTTVKAMDGMSLIFSALMEMWIHG